MAGRGEVIITVDKDLLALQTYRDIPIVKPGEFWKLLDSNKASTQRKASLPKTISPSSG